MHIGTLRVALFNYIAATQANQKLHVRIEDTDLKSDVAGKDQEILDILSLFGITASHISYQSHNLKFHQQLATKLLMDKNAFSCFCTPQMLENDQKEAQAENKAYQYNDRCRFLSDEEVLNNEMPFTVRIKRPDKDIDFSDIIQGEIHISKESIDSFLILHADKTPTYDFASAIDDMLDDVSMIIQEEEKLSTIPKQILIREYLGYDKAIRYAHLPSIIEQEEYTITKLLEEGFLPSAISNYLIMIGNQTPCEIFDLQEAITWFDLGKISKSPAPFELKRLRQINTEHIKKMPALELAKFIGYSSKDLGELAKIYTQEGSTINEIKAKIDAIFAKREPLTSIEEFHTLAKIAKEAPYFKAFEEFERHLLEESRLDAETFSGTLRLLLTGAENGPALADIYPHIKNYLGEIIK